LGSGARHAQPFQLCTQKPCVTLVCHHQPPHWNAYTTEISKCYRTEQFVCLKSKFLNIYQHTTDFGTSLRMNWTY
jgi:hypothetical protein